ncbi:methionyl-tRNA formyltransferase, mitochondrial [Plakobranchus ocellatus]|uniref:methionyl-tRNA formyltransferase n=1 Tax=Plakobranchus ocellatus TaxID=259542 RepID=A0AAV4DHH2_9GAST|nr:methionyl-tRNA formyltransferase, mitochondrial [Plakobranchus ocellatus]
MTWTNLSPLQGSAVQKARQVLSAQLPCLLSYCLERNHAMALWRSANCHPSVGFCFLSNLTKYQDSVEMHLPSSCKMRIVSPCLMRSNPPWRVLFFGTDEFSVSTLQALNEDRLFAPNESKLVELLHIVHPRTKKPSPVMKYAALHDLRGYIWPLKNLNKDQEYDVGVLASFGHLIPSRLVKAFPYGILNVHPSLLPRWRGAAPVHHTILNGDRTSGVCIMSIQPKVFDCGPLLAQATVDIPPRCSQVLLRDMLAHKGTHKISQNMTFIDWQNQTTEDIDCQYRALHETAELRTEWQGMTIRLVNMLDIRHQPDIKTEVTPVPGLPIYNKADGTLWVCCKNGWVGFSHVVIKKKMTAKSFYNGYLSKPQHKSVTFTSHPSGVFGDAYTKWILSPRPS